MVTLYERGSEQKQRERERERVKRESARERRKREGKTAERQNGSLFCFFSCSGRCTARARCAFRRRRNAYQRCRTARAAKPQISAEKKTRKRMGERERRRQKRRSLFFATPSLSLSLSSLSLSPSLFPLSLYILHCLSHYRGWTRDHPGNTRCSRAPVSESRLNGDEQVGPFAFFFFVFVFCRR